jgi:hypothetical protein
MTNRTIGQLFLIALILFVISIAGASAGSKQYLARGVSDASPYVKQAFNELGWGAPGKMFLREVSYMHAGTSRCKGRNGQSVCVEGKGKQGKKASRYNVYIK